MTEVHRFESHLPSFDKTELFVQSWRSPGAKLTLLITHGLGEHSDNYQALAEFLATHRIDALAWDLRGHGRSEGKRGFASDFQDFIRDLSCVVKEISKTLATPLALMGHSLGGLILYHYLIEENPQDVSAVVLSAPAVGLALPVPPWKEQASQIARALWPKLTLFNEIKDNMLTRDPLQWERNQKDPLRHDRISPEVFLGMTHHFAPAFDKAPTFLWPTLMQVGGADPIVSATEVRRLYELLGSTRKVFRVYPESYHEVYNDLDSNVVKADLLEFLRKVIS